MNIRFAEQQDILRIAEIYNHSIDDTLITTREPAHTYSERVRWFESRDTRYKIMVICDGENVVGFGSLEPFSIRHCFKFVAECAIYIEPAYRGKGCATALIKKLIRVAESVGFYSLTITLFEINLSAIHLYTSLGFEQVGCYEHLGYYQGKLLDAMTFSKKLPYDEETITNFYEHT